MRRKKFVLARVNLKKGDTIIPSVYACYADVRIDCDSFYSSIVITNSIINLAVQNIKGLGSVSISKKLLSYTTSEGGVKNIQDVSTEDTENVEQIRKQGLVYSEGTIRFAFPDNVQEIVLELTVPQDFEYSPKHSGSFSHIDGQSHNLMCFLSMNILLYMALSLIAPKHTDARLVLLSSIVLSSNIATLFLHPKAHMKEALYNTLCNTAISTASAVLCGAIIGSEKSWSFNKDDLYVMFAGFACVDLLATLSDPLYIGRHQLYSVHG